MNKNRILKFRVWDINGKKLHYPSLIAISTAGAVRIDYETNFLPGDSVISQFIGQLDKNNKEIYEGDIIRFYTSNYEGAFDRELQGRVAYNSVLARYNIVVLEGYKDGCYDLSECGEKEIIGNVFTNQPTTEKVVGNFNSEIPTRSNACPTCDCENSDTKRRINLEESKKLAKKIWEASMEDGYNS